jgi:hypothetical protein
MDQAQTDTAQPVAGEAGEAEENVFTLAEVARSYFTSSQLQDASELIGNVTEAAEREGKTVKFNFDIKKEMTPGYGIMVAPISKRTEAKGNVVTGIAVAAIPDLATVQAHENGASYVQDVVIASMVNKLLNAVRPRGAEGAIAASVPFTVDDFITSNRAEGVLVAYRQLAPAYVKVLKKKGLKYLTETILRQTLSNAAFAEQQFPKITQDKWVALIDSMIAAATKDKLAPGMLLEWKATRDSVTIGSDDVDLSDLSFDEIGNEEEVATATPAETQLVEQVTQAATV